MSLDKAELTKSEAEKLNRFLGFGDLLNTDILFFGNEEGAGPEHSNIAQRHRAEVLLRIKYAWENAASTECLNRINPAEGFWATGTSFPSMRARCYNDLHYEFNFPKEDNVWKNATWHFPARIMMALAEQEQTGVNRWFKRKGGLSKNEINQIENIHHNGLYGLSPIKFSLTDWRPIPRVGTDIWPFTDDINPVEYRKAFDFNSAEKFYEDLRDTRLAMYKRVFNDSYIPIIFSYGETTGTMIPLMTNIIQHITGTTPTIYTATLPFRANKKIYWIKTKFAKGDTTFIFTNHFSNGQVTLEELQFITEQLRYLRDGKEITIPGTIYNPQKSKR